MIIKNERHSVEKAPQGVRSVDDRSQNYDIGSHQLIDGVDYLKKKGKQNMDVKINDRRINIPCEISTWGELLDWVESSHINPGECITHVYLGGNEELNYRDRLICDRELATVNEVALKSGDFDDIVRESLEELDHELNGAIKSARAIVRLFENHNEQEAYDQLAQLLDLIRIFYTVFSQDLGWNRAQEEDLSRLARSADLDRALNQLIEAQENLYWVSVCDVVENEIVPILKTWHALVKRAQTQLSSIS